MKSENDIMWRKKASALLLILAVVATTVMLVLPANAAISGYTPSEETAFEAAGYKPISTPAELAAIDVEKGGRYYLKNDITVSGISENVINKWAKGHYDIVLDGNGHTVHFSDGKAYGLFDGGDKANFVVKNLNVTGKIESSNESEHIGALICHGTGGTITVENVHVNLDITFTGAFDIGIGGFIGKTEGSVIIKGSTYKGTINTGTEAPATGKTSPAVGGIVGTVVGNARFENVTSNVKMTVANKEVQGLNRYAGGIAGNIEPYADEKAEVIFNNCASFGTISTVASYDTAVIAGGIVGRVRMKGNNDAQTYVRFEGCANSADITGAEAINAGGIAGQINATRKAEFVNCINVGKISQKKVEDDYVAQGGILGGYNCVEKQMSWSLVESSGLLIENCHNFGSVSGGNAGGILGFTSEIYSPGKNVIKNCSNFAVIEGWSTAGGIVGAMNNNNYSQYTGTVVDDLTFSADAEFSIENCYNEGQVFSSKSGSKAYAGGILGYLKDGGKTFTAVGCYDIGNHSALTAAAIIGGQFGSATLTNCGSNGTRVISGQSSTEVLADGSVSPNETNCTLPGATAKANAEALVAKLHPTSGSGYNSEGHWSGGCTQPYCIYKKPASVTAHNFDQKKTTDAYKKNEADCIHGAEYYYSCSCGAPGTATYYNTSGATGTHTFDKWEADGENHIRRCVIVGCTKTESESHSGGTADCKNKAVCSICSGAYGELGAHAYSDELHSNDEEHYKQCTLCDATTENEAHSGGKATCLKKAECEKCHVPYGKTSHHTQSTIWNSDKDRHWKVCMIVGCEMKISQSAHSFTGDGVCSVCNFAIPKQEEVVPPVETDDQTDIGTETEAPPAESETESESESEAETEAETEAKETERLLPVKVGGCVSVVGSSAVVAAALGVMGFAVSFKKKKDE